MTTLPHGGVVHQFSVPGKDGECKGGFCFPCACTRSWPYPLPFLLHTFRCNVFTPLHTFRCNVFTPLHTFCWKNLPFPPPPSFLLSIAAGHRASQFVSDDPSMDVHSTHRASYHSDVSYKADTMPRPGRYAHSQQPWSITSVSHMDMGLSTSKYSESLQAVLAKTRRPITAPAQLGADNRPPTTSGTRQRMVDDVALVTSDDRTAQVRAIVPPSPSRRFSFCVLCVCCVCGCVVCCVCACVLCVLCVLTSFR